MSSWPAADCNDFLSDRFLLWEIDIVCNRYAGAGTPSQYVGLDEDFPRWICVEVDKGIARYGMWVEARAEARKKVGKGKTQPLYKTLAEVLGIKEEQRRGGWADGADLTAASKALKTAMTQAIMRGEPPPDPVKFTEEWMTGQFQEPSIEDTLSYL